MSISAVDQGLVSLIERDAFRSEMNATGEAYAEMNTYISNIEADLRSIETFERDLRAQEQQGFDVGSSLRSLTFQREQLRCDMQFYVQMRDVYLSRQYSDLYKFAAAIAHAAATIEPRQPGQTVEDLAASKMGVARVFDPEASYSMVDSFNCLGLCENLLYELAADIAAFEPRIAEAESRARRGFQTGNLVSTMKAQQLRLRTEFQSSIVQIRDFLKNGRLFAARALKRVKLISNEIVTEQEVQDADDAGGAGGDDAGAGT